MVEVLRHYSNCPELLDDLERAVQQLAEAAAAAPVDERLSVHATGRVGRKHGLQDRLTEADVQKIVLSFEAGTPRHKIANEYGISVSSVGRLLRKWRAQQ